MTARVPCALRLPKLSLRGMTPWCKRGSVVLLVSGGLGLCSVQWLDDCGVVVEDLTGELAEFGKSPLAVVKRSIVGREWFVANLDRFIFSTEASIAEMEHFMYLMKHSISEMKCSIFFIKRSIADMEHSMFFME
ncbi:MAG: hypothetical protein V5B40_09775 [Candidatus Accumulibacter meliphilus]|uniref:hypothetical protein n=1 Tax=Candidatus Accumulibacter meliphilus TaxID=2211374 RepID=UPI002FC35C64